MDLNANMSAGSESYFLSIGEAVNMAAARLKSTVTLPVLDALIEAHLLPAYAHPRDQSGKYVLVTDLVELLPIISAVQAEMGQVNSDNFSLREGKMPATICAGICTQISLADALTADQTLALRPAVRNLANQAMHSNYLPKFQTTEYLYYGNTSVFSDDPVVGTLASQQITRSKLASPELQPDFARTAHYMGSKRRLGAFLIEAIATKMEPGKGVVLDLMCGSGAAASVLNRVWPTYASDALGFCRLLAQVQGGGFNLSRAEQVLNHVLPIAREHYESLSVQMHDLVETENRLFHDDINSVSLGQYQQFLKDTPLYHGPDLSIAWNPTVEVSHRQYDSTLRPYCLFASYFANIYFGLRQSVEIDSLRYAITMLPNSNDQSWALGALVVAASSLATTYAAHFAQPLLRDPEALTLPRLALILEKRAHSVQHEFSVRLRNLASQSAKIARPIKVLPGPWQTGLVHFAAENVGEPAVVYLDAPYTRDEYSRYYHVLETLTQYNYPTCRGVGRVPERHVDLFASEFFTKTQAKVEDILTRIISHVLGHGWVCAWSYSDSGAARITTVVEAIVSEFPRVKVSSYSVPYKHKSHGRRPGKQVTEYIVMFEVC